MTRKNPIKDFFVFIIDDFKSDIRTIKTIKAKLETGEIKNPITLRNVWKFILEIPYIIAENWLFFMMLILAFTCGYFVASQHYQDECNKIILTDYMGYECIENECLPRIINNTFQPTYPYLGITIPESQDRAK